MININIKLYNSFLLGVFFFGLLAGFSSCSSSAKDAEEEIEAKDDIRLGSGEVYPLLEREGAIQNEDEWMRLNNSFTKAADQVQEKPDELKNYITLAQLYQLEGRITGNYDYYHDVTLKTIDHVSDKAASGSQDEFNALSIKAVVLLSQHKFEKALKVAQAAREINSYNAQIVGALVDANVELGNYEKAVKLADEMVSIRPDLRSYSRVSYLREIHGDIEGAKEAMDRAIKAGYPGYEQTAWALYTLGTINSTYGNLSEAEQAFQEALSQRPGYPYAIAGMADLELKKSNYEKAESYALKAIETMELPYFYEILADIHEATGNENKAQAAAESARELMTSSDSDHGHSHETGLEMAQHHLKYTHDYDEALHMIEHEFAKRPENIDVNRTMAMIYYQMENFEKAAFHAQKAMATGSKHPEALMVAGLAKVQQGNQEDGKTLVYKSLEQDPYQINPLAKEGKLMVTN